LKTVQEKEKFREAALRALTWASIFAAVVVFWIGVGFTLAAWVR
jgi:hypothetical protein